MSADERCYATFDNVSRSYHQVVNHWYDIRKYDFESLTWMEFKGGDVGQCDVWSKGWLSIFSYVPESDTIGTLTVDIGTEEKRCKTFSLRGHVINNKGFMSIAETDNGRERICTFSFESTKITATFISIGKIFSGHKIDNEIRMCREDNQRSDRRKDEEKKRTYQKEKPKKDKDKRSREDHIGT